MNQFAAARSPNNDELTCNQLITTAEEELSAFFRAVADLFGSEQAKLSVEDWLRELAASADLPSSTRHWRVLTVKAAARLASRVHAASTPAAS